jgi:hypothetical protein
MHSFTHSGLGQLSRRFTGSELAPNYGEQDILRLIAAASGAAFMVTALATKYFGFEEEWVKANALYVKYGTPDERAGQAEP